jgi:hypothetical protein
MIWSCPRCHYLNEGFVCRVCGTARLMERTLSAGRMAVVEEGVGAEGVAVT